MKAGLLHCQINKQQCKQLADLQVMLVSGSPENFNSIFGNLHLSAQHLKSWKRRVVEHQSIYGLLGKVHKEKEKKTCTGWLIWLL